KAVRRRDPSDTAIDVVTRCRSIFVNSRGVSVTFGTRSRCWYLTIQSRVAIVVALRGEDPKAPISNTFVSVKRKPLGDGNYFPGPIYQYKQYKAIKKRCP